MRLLLDHVLNRLRVLLLQLQLHHLLLLLHPGLMQLQTQEVAAGERDWEPGSSSTWFCCCWFCCCWFWCICCCCWALICC